MSVCVCVRIAQKRYAFSTLLAHFCCCSALVQNLNQKQDKRIVKRFQQTVEQMADRLKACFQKQVDMFFLFLFCLSISAFKCPRHSFKNTHAHTHFHLLLHPFRFLFVCCSISTFQRKNFNAKNHAGQLKHSLVRSAHD